LADDLKRHGEGGGASISLGNNQMRPRPLRICEKTLTPCLAHCCTLMPEAQPQLKANINRDLRDCGRSRKPRRSSNDPKAALFSLRYSSGVRWLDALRMLGLAIRYVGVVLRRLATIETAIVAHDSDFAVMQLIDPVRLAQ
jgi:hypothetical protein